MPQRAASQADISFSWNMLSAKSLMQILVEKKLICACKTELITDFIAVFAEWLKLEAHLMGSSVNWNHNFTGTFHCDGKVRMRSIVLEPATIPLVRADNVRANLALGDTV